MDAADAARLIAPAVHRGEKRADLGAGTGTFTIALARLVGPTGAVYAVEREPSAAEALRAMARENDPERARMVVLTADFTERLELPSLDGVLLANALHFVDGDVQAEVLHGIAGRLGPGGAVVIVEYDNRPASRWVPFPVSMTRLTDLARLARLGAPEQIGRRRSMFGGSMYAARLSSR
jgi:SAM-dependent methyltransferase